MSLLSNKCDQGSEQTKWSPRYNCVSDSPSATIGSDCQILMILNKCISRGVCINDQSMFQLMLPPSYSVFWPFEPLTQGSFQTKYNLTNRAHLQSDNKPQNFLACFKLPKMATFFANLFIVIMITAILMCVATR